MSVAGSPDFITQQGDTNTFLAEFTGNSLVINVEDLTPFIDPSQQALLVQVIGQPGSPVTRLGLLLQYDTAIQVSNQQILAYKDVPCTMPLDSQILAQGEATALRLSIQRYGTDATGAYKVHVWAITAPPTVYTVRKYDLSGRGNTNSVLAGAGTTVNVMPQALPGTYRRVRIMSYTTAAGPGVAAINGFNLDANITDLWTFFTPAAAFSADKVPVDFSTDSGISIRNTTTVGMIATIAWEEVPL